ncbi:MAG TPA: GNAT family N-acetyltransferase [Acidimicrobiales bacterium]|nr:GNAT family N-acetyltransferase [Acidimicrobiales bacterium]
MAAHEQVIDVEAEGTYDLRRRVLRGERPDAEVAFAEDAAPGVSHLALKLGDGPPVAVVTVVPAACPLRPGRRAWRIRGMAVDPAEQGRGRGGVLLAEVEARARRAGIEVVWADGRDASLPFYRRHGWQVEGEGYLTPDTGLPHHRIVLDLDRTG